jgi:hypothetical protein
MTKYHCFNISLEPMLRYNKAHAEKRETTPRRREFIYNMNAIQRV